ncbi:MAG: CoA-disulfide reductase [Chloroflexota bacterium]|nr:MAG: CoA-disulfide reductase [Anaerolineaceae bacterium 4572_5.2]RLD03224.1 MAG: CoA-disulfide reductase [Chloroflexota bacterium]
MSERLVIIGGCAAGMSAASKARRLNPNLEIAVYEKTGFVSYGSCGMPYYISGVIDDYNKLVVRTPEQFAEKNIEVHLHHEVIEIDAENHRVSVKNIHNSKRKYANYDKLLITTGGRPSLLPTSSPGELEGVFTLRALEDGIAVSDFVHQEQPQHAVIVGAGYIGLEMAESFHSLGLDVTVIGRPPQVLKRFDPDMAKHVQQETEGRGIKFSLGDEVQALEGDGRGKVRQVISSKGIFKADLVLLALGVRPNAELAKAAGVVLGETGAIATDAQMRTNLSGVFSAGDCAEAYHTVTKHGVYIPLGTTANKQGRIAGTNIGGGEATFQGIAGTAITKVFDLFPSMTGLSEKDAQAAGYKVKSTVIKAKSCAHYYPGCKSMHVKLVVEEGSGRLLGGQIVGGQGAGTRINALATALHQEMTVQELTKLDLAYVPPISPVWDPLLVAANVACKG